MLTGCGQSFGRSSRLWHKDSLGLLEIDNRAERASVGCQWCLLDGPQQQFRDSDLLRNSPAAGLLSHAAAALHDPS